MPIGDMAGALKRAAALCCIFVLVAAVAIAQTANQQVDGDQPIGSSGEVDPPAGTAVTNDAVPAASSTPAPLPTFDPSSWQSKLSYHAENAYGIVPLLGSFAYDGILQEKNYPREWGQGATGYTHRVGSTLAYAGLRGALSFGLDTALHQDPRYYRLGATRGAGNGHENVDFWRRTGYAVRMTFLTRKDSGGETFATWRFGSAFGAELISNEWYPDRLNTVKLGLEGGVVQIGLDVLSNIGAEFWPDIKKMILPRKP